VCVCLECVCLEFEWSVCVCVLERVCVCARKSVFGVCVFRVWVECVCVCVSLASVSIKKNLSIASAVAMVTVSPLALCSHGVTSKWQMRRVACVWDLHDHRTNTHTQQQQKTAEEMQQQVPLQKLLENRHTQIHTHTHTHTHTEESCAVRHLCGNKQLIMHLSADWWRSSADWCVSHTRAQVRELECAESRL